MRTVRSNNVQNIQNFKRGLSSDKQIPYKVQRLNHIIEEPVEEPADQESNDAGEDLEPSFEDEINFLGEDPYSPTSSE